MLDSLLLKNNIRENRFLVADFETESLSLINARPWQIAWDVYDGYNKIESHQYYLSWPNLNVSKGAAEATGFDAEKVKKDGRNPKEIIDLFNTYLYDKQYKCLGHNFLGYDAYVHNTCMLELGYKTNYSYLSRTYDTLCLARSYRLGIKPPEDIKDFLAWQYRLLQIFKKGLKCKNSELAAEFGYDISTGAIHSASFDIELTAFVFFNLIKKLDIQ